MPTYSSHGIQPVQYIGHIFPIGLQPHACGLGLATLLVNPSSLVVIGNQRDAFLRCWNRALCNNRMPRTAVGLGDVGFMSALARCELLAASGHAGCMCIPNLRG